MCVKHGLDFYRRALRGKSQMQGCDKVGKASFNCNYFY